MVEKLDTFRKNKSQTLHHLIEQLPEENGVHIMYMFNEYEDYLDNAVTFITDGLDEKQRVFLVESEYFYSTIVKKLLQKGYEEDLDLLSYHCNTEFYNSEEFCAARTLKNLVDYLKQYEQGSRMRIWGHVLNKNASIRELRMYENDCDTLLYEKNIVSVCCYNALTTPAYFQNELLKVHEYLMLDNQVEKSPFYNRNYLSRFSDSEKERLQKLEKENELLKEKNEQLVIDQTEQKEREKYLQLAKANAEKANHAKSVFLSQMSHDLRTPLNTIQGYAQVINMSERNPELQKKINKIYQASEQLLKLMEEILDFTVIDSGKININKEVVELKSFLMNCIESILEINDSDITIELEEMEEGIYLELDPFRFNQILMNLVNNAIKYNQPHGTVTIYCDYPKHSKEVTINIRDTGVGIVEGEKDLIFEPFYRSRSTMNNWEGTGLGLAIVAQLTKRMNGKYGVISDKDNGSTFWVSFTRVMEKQQDDVKDEGTKKRLSRAGAVVDVLYIEDNQDNIDVMTLMMNLMDNIKMSYVTSGKAGIDKAFEMLPDIILLDLSLPDITGFEVLHKLKSNPITKEIPIVAVSANALETSIKKALLEGCLAYVTKPINYEELRAVIAKVLRVSEHGK